MKRLSRKQLLGAGGAAGLALGAPSLARAGDDGDAMFVHIDGIVTGPAGTLVIDVDVAGTRRKLDGDGWDTVHPGESWADACIFTQHGSIRRGQVELSGKTIFANTPDFRDQVVTTKANLETGRIDWTFGGFPFTGQGRVIIAEAEGSDDD